MNLVLSKTQSLYVVLEGHVFISRWIKGGQPRETVSSAKPHHRHKARRFAATPPKKTLRLLPIFSRPPCFFVQSSETKETISVEVQLVNLQYWVPLKSTTAHNERPTGQRGGEEH